MFGTRKKQFHTEFGRRCVYNIHVKYEIRRGLVFETMQCECGHQQEFKRRKASEREIELNEVIPGTT